MGKRINSDDAEAIMVGALLEPLVSYPGAHVPWRCRCLICDHEVTPTLRQVRINKTGSGCVLCAPKRRACTLRLDADECAAYMVSRGFEPLVSYPGAHVPWRCRCHAHGHVVTPTLITIRNSSEGRGCNECGNALIGDALRHDADEAAAVMLAADLEPIEPYVRSSAPWRCRCLICDHEVTPALSNVQAGSRCKFCAGRSGYTDPIVYLLRHAERQIDKVGLSGVEVGSRRCRIVGHERHGWSVVGIWSVATMTEATEIETSILDYWRDECGAPEGCTREEMPQAGYTETVPSLWPGVDEARSRIEALVA